MNFFCSAEVQPLPRFCLGAGLKFRSAAISGSSSGRGCCSSGESSIAIVNQIGSK
jgi:hypothetical protein